MNIKMLEQETQDIGMPKASIHECLQNLFRLFRHKMKEVGINTEMTMQKIKPICRIVE